MTAFLEQLPLPVSVSTALISLAESSDILLIGELHGTQEVPRLLAGLLPTLKGLGYGSLGLEISCEEREALAAWAAAPIGEPPPFFAHPGADGRGNAQALALAQQAAAQGWELLCFDVAFVLPDDPWSARDGGMARNLMEQRQKFGPGSKTLCVCGSLHSRTHNPGDFFKDHWPSFASWLQTLYPEAAIRSVEVVFHSGTFFNMEPRTIPSRPLAQAEMRQPEGRSHTWELYLPQATAVTFLREPRTDF